jgi:copper transport protein
MPASTTRQMDTADAGTPWQSGHGPEPAIAKPIGNAISRMISTTSTVARSLIVVERITDRFSSIRWHSVTCKRTLLWRGLVLALLLSLAAPAVAQAHAVLLASSPHAGEILGTTPGVVTLRFSEPLEPRSSTVTVSDPAGASFAGTASGTRLVVPVTTNLPGSYVVKWRSVSAEDGHTTTGSFKFSVQSGGGAGPQTSNGGVGDPGLAVLRWIEYLALLLAIGTITIRRLGRRDPPTEWVHASPSKVVTVLLIAGLSVALGDAFVSAGSASAHSMVTYLMSGRPGISRLAVVAAAAGALVAARWGHRLWPWLLAAVVALASSGHAAAANPAWWGIAVDAVHLLAAGVWAGGIMALAMLRPPGGWRGEEARRLLDRFSPAAITAFGLTVIFGFIQGVQDVGHLSAIFSSTYGRTLGLKVVAVAAMVPLSVLAWRRHVSPRIEALIAVLVIGASALLSTSALPAEEAARAIAQGTRAPQTALPQTGDLTLGSHAGQVLVGLTLRPGRPGANQVLVYLQPIEGSAAALHTTFDVNGRPSELHVCGSACRDSTVSLTGGERVSVSVAGSTGGEARFTIPQLPAVAAPSLLAKAQARMHALTSYRLSEVLSSGLASVTTHYAFRSPDRMKSRGGGTSVVLIGGTRYLRESPNAPWRTESGGPPLKVPSFIWDFFTPLIDVRSLGEQHVDGVRTNVLAFFGSSGGTPVWFRLWIDSRGFVHQAHMRAVGHFMDHRYFDFDAPLRIRPPTE